MKIMDLFRKRMVEVKIDSEEDELLVNLSRVREAAKMFAENCRICCENRESEFYEIALYYNEKGIVCPLVFEAQDFPDRQTELNGFVDASIVRCGIENELKKKGFSESRAEIMPFEYEGGADGICIMLYARF